MKSNSKPITFKSKRNTVILHSGIVEKHFASAKAAAFEAQTLQKLHTAGLRVPEVYALDGAILKMQYIPGKTLPDLIEHWENGCTPAEIAAVANSIISWLAEFYFAVDTKQTTEIRGDINGRNFILDGTYCWGVDFEEKTHGTREQDIGRLIAFILTYTPPGTPLKIALADTLLHKAMQVLGVNEQEVCNWRDSELQAMQLRRIKNS